MDDPLLDADRHRQALRALVRINRIGATARTVAQPILELAREKPGRTLRVLDIACGGGDVVLQLAKRARRQDVPLIVEGCDISETAIGFAQKRAAGDSANLRYFTCDVLQDELPGGYDVIMCNLFLHHLADEQAADLLSSMRQAAGEMVVVTDLERSKVGYHFVAWGSRLISRSRIVHHDAALSVRAAFTRDEAHTMAQQAGLTGATVTRLWPFRWRLLWRRNAVAAASDFEPTTAPTQP